MRDAEEILARRTLQRVPLGADKMGHCNSEFLLIETFCKRQFFQQNDFNASIFHNPTLGSNHRCHSLWCPGLKVEEVGRGEGTPVELV